MRPRHRASESQHAGQVWHERGRASMRPRHRASESGDRAPRRHGRGQASMRPRHRASESPGCGPPTPRRPGRFNEAEAQSLGKRDRIGHLLLQSTGLQ